MTEASNALRKLADEEVSVALKSTADTAEPLRQAIAYAAYGGKRVRPILAMLSAQAVGGRAQDALSIGIVIELIHCYSLVHDDLPAMDDDDTRRGEPTVHCAFDEATAILTGDSLLTLAFEYGLSHKLDAEQLLYVARNAGAVGMIGGQTLDINYSVDEPTLDRLEKLNLLKTGCLISAATGLGAMAGGGTDGQAEAMFDFGRNIALAFQATDDLLDKEKSLSEPNYVALLGERGTAELAEEYTAKAISYLDSLGDNANALREYAIALLKRNH